MFGTAVTPVDIEKALRETPRRYVEDFHLNVERGHKALKGVKLGAVFATKESYAIFVGVHGGSPKFPIVGFDVERGEYRKYTWAVIERIRSASKEG